MKKGLMFLALAVLLGTSTAYATPILNVDIANAVGKNLIFTGDPNGQFYFADEATGSNDDFKITNQEGGTGALLGLRGDIDGIFTFPNPLGASSVAVTSPSGAVFTIGDGAGNTFSAPVNFLTLIELGGPFGGIGGTVVLGGGSSWALPLIMRI